MEKKNEDEIPLVQTLEEIYDTDSKGLEDEHIPKYMGISRRFEEIYNGKPEFFSRAPGRVRVLGDYLEFNDYPFVSVALEQDVIIAFKESAEPYIEINNFIENLYRHIKIPIDGNMKPFEAGQDKWANLILQGLRHTLDELQIKANKGVQMLVYSNILEDAGIGFEDALVVAIEILAYKIYGNKEIVRKECIVGVDSVPVLYSVKNNIIHCDLNANLYLKFPEKYSLIVIQ